MSGSAPDKTPPTDAAPKDPPPREDSQWRSNLSRAANRALARATNPLIGAVASMNNRLFDPIVYRVPPVRNFFFQPIGRVHRPPVFFEIDKSFVEHFDEDGMAIIVPQSPPVVVNDGPLSGVPFAKDLYIDEYVSKQVIEKGAELIGETDDRDAPIEEREDIPYHLLAEHDAWFALHGTPTRESRDRLQRYAAKNQFFTLQHTYRPHQFTISTRRIEDLKTISKIYWPDIADTPKRSKKKISYGILLSGNSQEMDVILLKCARKLQEDKAVNEVTVKYGKTVGIEKCVRRMSNQKEYRPLTPIHQDRDAIEYDFVVANYSFVCYPELIPTPASLTVPVLWSSDPESTPQSIEILHCHPKKGKLFDVANLITRINSELFN